MPLSISRCVLSCHLWSQRLARGLDRQRTANLFRKLVHPKRFGDVRQVVTFQELSRLRRHAIAGHEKEALSQRTSGTLQRFIEMLPSARIDRPKPKSKAPPPAGPGATLVW